MINDEQFEADFRFQVIENTMVNFFATLSLSHLMKRAAQAFPYYPEFTSSATLWSQTRCNQPTPSARSLHIIGSDGGATRCRMLLERGTPHRHPEQLPGSRRDEWAEGHPPGPWEVQS